MASGAFEERRDLRARRERPQDLRDGPIAAHPDQELGLQDFQLLHLSLPTEPSQRDGALLQHPQGVAQLSRLLIAAGGLRPGAGLPEVSGGALVLPQAERSIACLQQRSGLFVELDRLLVLPLGRQALRAGKLPLRLARPASLGLAPWIA